MGRRSGMGGGGAVWAGGGGGGGGEHFITPTFFLLRFSPPPSPYTRGTNYTGLQFNLLHDCQELTLRLASTSSSPVPGDVVFARWIQRLGRRPEGPGCAG